MSPAPSTTMETPFGTLRLIAHSANEVMLTTSYDRADPHQTITVNRVEYTSVRVSFARYADNPSDAPFSPYREYYANGERFHIGHAVWLTRVDRYEEGSDAAKRKVADVCTQLVNEWQATPAGRALLTDALHYAHQDAIDRAQRDVEEAAVKLAEASDTLKATQQNYRYAVEEWEAGRADG